MLFLPVFLKIKVIEQVTLFYSSLFVGAFGKPQLQIQLFPDLGKIQKKILRLLLKGLRSKYYENGISLAESVMYISVAELVMCYRLNFANPPFVKNHTYFSNQQRKLLKETPLLVLKKHLVSFQTTVLNGNQKDESVSLFSD